MISCHARAGRLVGHRTDADPEDLITAQAVTRALDANRGDSQTVTRFPARRRAERRLGADPAVRCERRRRAQISQFGALRWRRSAVRWRKRRRQARQRRQTLGRGFWLAGAWRWPPRRLGRGSQALLGVAGQQTSRPQAHNTNPAGGGTWALANPLPGPTKAAASLCLARFARRRRENEIGGTATPSAPPGWRRPRSRLRRTRRPLSDHRRWR